MSTYTYTESYSKSFTITDARHIAARVATDLLRFQRFYDRPSDAQINDYEAELVSYLNGDYLDNVIYGFQRDGRWVEALRYRVVSGTLLADDDPGKLRPDADVTGAHFTSFLTTNSRWLWLSEAEKQRFYQGLPFQRTTGTEPGVENGYWVSDNTYSAGGRGVSRSTIRRY